MKVRKQIEYGGGNMLHKTVTCQKSDQSYLVVNDFIDPEWGKCYTLLNLSTRNKIDVAANILFTNYNF